MPGENTPKPARRRMVSKQLVKWDTELMNVTGTLTVKERQTIEGRECGRYEIESAGSRYVINGAIQIDEAMTQVEVGDMVEIVYLGEVETSNGWMVKRFEVFVLEVDSDNG